LDIAQGETAESHLDALIAKRDKQRRRVEGERPEHELYAESVRRYLERERRSLNAQRYTFHMNMCELHEALGREHEQEALRLLEDEPNTNGHNGHHKRGAA
jgi:hypothetical protein